MTRTRLISWSVSILVLMVSAIAFVLSYNALRDVAAGNGLSDWRSYLWPLLIDFPLVVFSLAVLWANLNQVSAKWQWSLVGLFTIATITFNLIHAPDTLTARAVAVVAPLALFLSFETLVGMIRNEIKRGSALASLGDINQQVSIAQEQLTALRQRVKSANTRNDSLQEEADRLTAEIKALTEQRESLAQEQLPESVRANDTRQRIIELLSENDKLTSTEIADQVGVSAGRVRQIRQSLVKTNGNGNHQ